MNHIFWVFFCDFGTPPKKNMNYDFALPLTHAVFQLPCKATLICPRIEPDTPGILSQNHTPRPTLFVKKGVQESQQIQWLLIAVQG